MGGTECLEEACGGNNDGSTAPVVTGLGGGASELVDEMGMAGAAGGCVDVVESGATWECFDEGGGRTETCTDEGNGLSEEDK